MKNRWNGLIQPYALMLLIFTLLAGCAGMNQGDSAIQMPSQDAIRDELSQASMPGELREQIIRLYSQDPQQRARAATHLGKMAEAATPAVPYLIQLLRDNTSVQVSHYLGSGYYSSVETTPGEEASRALSEIGGPALDSLLLALKSPYPDVRRLIARALGQIGDLKSVDFLIRLLSDPDKTVRASAVIALGNYHNPMAAQTITDAYATSGPAVRADMIYALARINDILPVPFLISHAKDPDKNIRAAIMLALGNMRDARGVPALLEGLHDTDVITRANAAHGLGAYFSPTVVDALIGALADKEERVRQAASESLGNMSALNFGMDQGKWQSWWLAQKKLMQPVAQP